MRRNIQEQSQDAVQLQMENPMDDEFSRAPFGRFIKYLHDNTINQPHL
jgi:hypothetical protein